MQEVYISVDIEAAGPIPSTYSMLSLGAVAVDNPQATFYVELRPVNDESVPGAMKVVGRTLEDFARIGRDPKEAMAAFRDWLSSVSKAAKPVFVGFRKLAARPPLLPNSRQSVSYHISSWSFR